MTRASRILQLLEYDVGAAKQQIWNQMGNKGKAGMTYSHKTTTPSTDHPVATVAHGAGKLVRKVQDNPKAALATAGAGLAAAALARRRRR